MTKNQFFTIIFTIATYGITPTDTITLLAVLYYAALALYYGIKATKEFNSKE